MSHTPGPWTLEHWGGREIDVCGGDKTIVCILRGGITNPDDDSEPDAALIAAAPDMLAALKRMREVFEQLSDGDWRELDATYVDQLIESYGLYGCDQAIAKAERR